MAQKKLIVIALGGHALIKQGEKGTISEQEKNGMVIAESLFKVLESSQYDIVITHGNGPQAGHSLLKNEKCKDILPPLPLDVCVAENQGSMGYILQQAIMNKFRKESKSRSIVTMITQVKVSKFDKAFKNPTKPIGPFYTKDEIEEILKRENWPIVEDAGRGYRRVVPSPEPLEIIQLESIKHLVHEGHIIITLGGGGIPVWEKDDGDFEGIEAVIDKDISSAQLASKLSADLFIILTEVEYVYLNYGKKNQHLLNKIDINKAKEYLKNGEFGEGNMEPKIKAALLYLESGGKEVIITEVKNFVNALTNNEGTHIIGS